MSRENAKTVRAAHEAARDGDLPGFLSHIDPEVDFTSIITRADGDGYRGHEGVRRWIQALSGTFDSFWAETSEIRDLGGDLVLAKLLLRATVSGIEVKQPIWQLVILDHKRITGWSMFRSEEGALEAAGLLE